MYKVAKDGGKLVRVPVYLNEDQYESLKEMAESDGLGLSVWIRLMIIKEIEKRSVIKRLLGER